MHCCHDAHGGSRLGLASHWPALRGRDFVTVNAAAVVITERPGVSDARGLAGREADALVLTAEERRWGRRRATTRGGREVVLALPTGTVMAPGDVLYVAEDWY